MGGAVTLVYNAGLYWEIARSPAVRPFNRQLQSVCVVPAHVLLEPHRADVPPTKYQGNHIVTLWHNGRIRRTLRLTAHIFKERHMLATASAVVLSLSVTAGAAVEPRTTHQPFADAVAASVSVAGSDTIAGPGMTRRNELSPVWMSERSARPRALTALYASLAGLNVLDAVTTRRAVSAGATELNPVVQEASKNTAAMLAVKALGTAGSIYFTERAWKKNRKGAVILMAVLNGVTAAVVANNMSHAR
jgi:hypothetical protein